MALSPHFHRTADFVFSKSVKHFVVSPIVIQVRVIVVEVVVVEVDVVAAAKLEEKSNPAEVEEVVNFLKTPDGSLTSLLTSRALTPRFAYTSSVLATLRLAPKGTLARG